MRKTFVYLGLILASIFLAACIKNNVTPESDTYSSSADVETVSDKTPDSTAEETSEPIPSDDVEPAADQSSNLVTIEVTSESLTQDGKWITDITSFNATPAGKNLTPQLSWSEVEGATVYAIYMIDISADNWIHWKAKNVQVTSLELGAELEDSLYIGPYPPSGTNEYKIIVYALKTTPDKYPGSYNSSNAFIEKLDELDIANGQPGNILGIGSISGTVTVGETVE